MDEPRAVRPAWRSLVAIAYAQPVERPKHLRRAVSLPGPVHDALLLLLFMVLGLGLLVSSVLPG